MTQPNRQFDTHTTQPVRADLAEQAWAEPLSGQLATLRRWRQGVNALAVVAGLALVGGVIAWLASGAI